METLSALLLLLLLLLLLSSSSPHLALQRCFWPPVLDTNPAPIINHQSLNYPALHVQAPMSSFSLCATSWQQNIHLTLHDWIWRLSHSLVFMNSLPPNGALAVSGLGTDAFPQVTGVIDHHCDSSVDILCIALPHK